MGKAMTPRDVPEARISMAALEEIAANEYLAPSVYRSALLCALSTIAEMRGMIARYASECGECGGKGERIADSLPIRSEPCPDCADIRALLSRLPVASPASPANTEAKT